MLGNRIRFKEAMLEEKLDTALTGQSKLLPPMRIRWTLYASGCDTLRKTQRYLFRILIRGV